MDAWLFCHALVHLIICMLGNIHIPVVCCFVLWGPNLVVVVFFSSKKILLQIQLPSRPGSLTNNKSLRRHFILGLHCLIR